MLYDESSFFVKYLVHSYKRISYINEDGLLHYDVRAVDKDVCMFWTKGQSKYETKKTIRAIEYYVWVLENLELSICVARMATSE